MKDATGELSMTAIAVVAIAAIGVVFTTLIWPGIKSTILRSQHCSQAIRCDAPDPNSNTQTCYYLEEITDATGNVTSAPERAVTCTANN